jgi:PAS domain S-box-containing protein
LNFLPLKHYYRSLSVALLMLITVAFFLCLYIYNSKLDRSIEKSKSDFSSVSAQVEHGARSASDLLSIMFEQHQLELFTAPSPSLFEKINQYNHYYYRRFEGNAGEIVGQGQFIASTTSALRWQQAKTLEPNFNTALSLLQTVSAIAYVDGAGFAYVKRRDQSESGLLTSILDGRFKPNFSANILSSSSLVNVNGKSYFAIGRQRVEGSSDYIILIYDVDSLSLWLRKISSDGGEYIFMNQSHKIIASSKNVIDSNTSLHNYWPIFAQRNHEFLLTDERGYFFMQPLAELPIHAAFYESKYQLRNVILYEVALEFTLLILFLSLMFSVFFILNREIFVEPVTYLMRYLGEEKIAHVDGENYAVPDAWQPWFSKVKGVFAKNAQLVESLQLANKELDKKVQLQSQKLLRSYEAKERHLALLNTMLNSVPDLIYFKNIDGTFLGCNKAYEAYINTEQAALVGKQLSDITDEYAHINALEEQVLVSRNNVLQRIDTEDKSYQLTIAPFYNEHQQLLGTVGIGRDITEQQHALYALKASESKFRSAIEFAANSVVLLSLEYTILQVNKSARKLFKSHDVLNGESFNTLFDNEHWVAIKDKLQRLLEDKKQVQHLTINQGELASWLQISMSLVWEKNHAHSYYVIHIQDVSALTKAKENAERATLAKSRFIANLSHEIRTPLNAVLGLLNMVEEQGLTPQQLQQSGQAKQAAHSLLLMLNRMLDFARVESEQAQLKLAPFGLVELVDTCESITAALCEQKNIGLNIDVDPLISPFIVGDFIRLQQILGNLLTNAVKFTDLGFVSLKMHLLHSDSAQYQRIRFDVIDTGSGIDKADQGRLFDAFTQGDESSTRTHHGVGLGLAIVKHAVSLLGGNIEIQSEKGQGCTFSFSLTLQVDEVKQNFEPAKVVAVSSAHSVKLNKALVAFPEFKVIDLDELLKYPIKLSDVQQLIVDSKDVGILLSHDAIEHILITKAASIIIVQEKSDEFKTVSTQLNVRFINNTALSQRLLGLNSESLFQQQPINNNTADVDISGLLVLAVDDNQLNLEIIKSVMRQAEVNIVTVTNAADAIELIQLLHPDLVLMDVQMPHIDGCQATKLIRQKFDRAKLPIFALTAHCEPSDVERSLQSGMNKHLTKPVIPVVLVSEIKDLNIAKPMFYDSKFALNQFDSDKKTLQTMNEKFKTLCESQLAQLHECNQKDEMVRLVHSIKGVAGNLGFKRLSGCALECERKLKASNEAMNITINDLIMQLNQVIIFIRSLEVKDVK